jgi:hypothetical protein
MSSPQAGEGPGQGKQAAGAAAPSPARGAARAPAHAEGSLRSMLRTGGCLLALLGFLVILIGVAIFYQPPKPPQVAGAAAGIDAGAALAVPPPAIRAAALSPDGSVLAYGGNATKNGRYTIELRRIADQRFVDRDAPLRTVAAHDGRVSAIRFRPDGREFLSASQDGTVGRWRVEDGGQLALLVPPGDRTKLGDRRSLLTLAVSPDGRMVASGGWTGDVYVWDLGQPGAPPVVLPGRPWPWETDPKTIVPTGHVEEVRTLAWAPGDPALLFSGGGEGLVIGWNLAQRKAGRVVSMDGKTPNIRDLMMRQYEKARDTEFAIVCALAAPVRNGLFVADSRGCVYLLTTVGPCRDWWLGGASPGTGCLRPLLDPRKICTPLDRPPGEAAAGFVALTVYPGIEGGFLGITVEERFRLFRPGDGLPWREFDGSRTRGEGIGAFAASGPAGLALIGTRLGRLRLYGFAPDPQMPDVRLLDRLP